MASKRELEKQARRAVFERLARHLALDTAGADPVETALLIRLISEFRRRGGLTPAAPPPDHDPIPGMGLFQALPAKEATPYEPT